MINFEDLKLEIQDEFISSNISEILYRQRKKINYHKNVF